MKPLRILSLRYRFRYLCLLKTAMCSHKRYLIFFVLAFDASYWNGNRGVCFHISSGRIPCFHRYVKRAILEFICGSSTILKHFPELWSCHTSKNIKGMAWALLWFIATTANSRHRGRRRKHTRVFQTQPWFGGKDAGFTINSAFFLTKLYNEP